ncbi:MAG: PIN domain-containing protein [Actinophytocola sp.]|nr:PIN domain-containing protein [Actinophytocola sp.]
MAKLIFDTGVLVAIDRGKLDLPSVLDDTDDVALPAVVIAEYLTGVAAQTNPAQQASARSFLSQLRDIAPVIDYDSGVAEHHAELLTYVRAQGEPRGAHDLIIAATGRATGRTVLTTDKQARFGELPGVTARLLN